MLKIIEESKLERSVLVQFFSDDDVYAGHFDITLSAENDKEKKISIWNLEIFPQFRGQGFGNQMAIEMVEILREKYSQYSKAYLRVKSSNIPAKKMYVYAGFVQVPSPVGWGNWAETMEINLTR